MFRPVRALTLLIAASAACVPPASSSQPPPPQPYGGPPGYAQPQQAPPQSYGYAAQPAPIAQPYPPPGAYPQPGPPPSPTAYPPPAPYPAPAPYPSPQAPPPPGASARPMLGLLVGAPLWQAETVAVLAELKSNLTPDNQRLVSNIPLTFDPDPGTINAYAGCDAGRPFLRGTEGMLEAIDAIAQTHATDELFGTRTYEAYVAAVVPRLVSQQGAVAVLPIGIIAPQQWVDPRRISRAHEMFDEIVAFTFGHELAHHYLGHTGCANGQPNEIIPGLSDLGRALSGMVNLFNQPNESAADTAGCINVLDTGRARASRAYRWTEEGGLWLLDLFARLDQASGANSPLVAFQRAHPPSSVRIPIVQLAAQTWRLQHPG